jgi:hypothetical protein
MVNAGAEAKTATLNLARFKGIKKQAIKTTLAGKPDAENNYEAQPIKPVKETVKAQKKQTIDLPAYTMIMLEYQL